MSTRCNIILIDVYRYKKIESLFENIENIGFADIEDSRGTLYLYKHHDGYPDGVGASLKKILSNDGNQHTDDSLLTYVLIEMNILHDYIKIKRVDTDITTGLHGDINYLYIIHDKTLYTYSVVYDKDSWDDRDQRFKLIDTFKFRGVDYAY
jgi:hypothetical protein